jgi:hypothetical protein
MGKSLASMKLTETSRACLVNVRMSPEGAVLLIASPHSYGDFLVVLRDGVELKLSRSYRQKVEASLGQSL